MIKRLKFVLQVVAGFSIRQARDLEPVEGHTGDRHATPPMLKRR